MKTVTITRGESTDQGTPGKFAFGTQTLACMELPWRDNQPGIGCVPLGTYSAAIYASPKHGTVYMLKAVPGRSDVEIHAANFAGDKALGWDCELEGCIAPAMRIGTMTNFHGAQQTGGMLSRAALAAFMDWAAGDPIQVVIQ